MILLLVFLIVACVLILPLYVVYKPPNALIRYLQQRWPDVIWQVPTTSGKVLALTIDDAPSGHSRELMQILAANNASATFFVIGSQVPGNEANLVDLVKAGHELGNHAMFDEASRSLSDTELRTQIEIVQGYIAAAYKAANVPQPTARYFRPGSGFFSTRMRENIASLGYKLVLGSIYPHDPQIPYAWINARHILSMARPGGIIICHDRRPWTAPMLGKVLPELRRRGYRINSLGVAFGNHDAVLE